MNPCRKDLQQLAEQPPFSHLVGLSRLRLKESREIPAAERRLLTAHFQESFTWSAMRLLLPLRFIVPIEVPTPPPRRYRSAYTWLPPESIRSGSQP